MHESFAVCAQLGKHEVPLLTLAISTDGSFSIQDRLKKTDPTARYEIVQFLLPTRRSEAQFTVNVKPPFYYCLNKPKLSHHGGGLFHISSADKGKQVVSGFDNNGKPKGIGNPSFPPSVETNDGGPIVGATFWGLNKMPTGTIKTSTPIVFTEQQIRDQAMSIDGSKLGVEVEIYHFKDTSDLDYVGTDWARYRYHKRRKPVLMRTIRNQDSGYTLGIACLLMRTNDPTDYGYRLGGGPGHIDANGDCLNTVIMFQMPNTVQFPDAINIDYP